jgi:hypothetical protein
LIPQRNTKSLGKVHDHLTAGPRASRFEIAEMTRRTIRRGREIHLSQPAPLSPPAKQDPV